MTSSSSHPNRVRDFRKAAGLTQAELAERAGISRTAISALEQERLTPAVTSALALAQVLNCTVENLFGDPVVAAGRVEWAIPVPSPPCRFWHAEVGDCRWLYPVEPTNCGEIPHDGIWNGKTFRDLEHREAESVLVIATCDPAVGLLVSEYARQTPFQLLPLTRSSRSALELMNEGKVHAAGIHLSSSKRPSGNASIVRETFGPGFQLLRMGIWQEGVALAPHLKLRSPESAARTKLHWVGREEGSGARKCLDELLAGRSQPRRTAPDHRSVALAIRHGWADAGVCLRLASEEAGLSFLELRREAYDMCFPEALEHDRRIRALVEVVRSPSYRRLLDSLPGYEARSTGDLTPC